MDEFTITKRISKMGDNNILIFPKDLKEQIQHGDLIEVHIKIISRAKKIQKITSAKNKSVQHKSKKKQIVDEKVLSIVKHLKKQGYDKESIKAVMKKNGYKLSEVNLALSSN